MAEAIEIKGQKRNPLIYLFGKTWEYSKGNKQSVVMYWTMFIIANAGALVIHPLILAKMFSTLQIQGVTDGNFWFLMELLGANLVVTFAFWGLHGPARCIERANAYKVRAGYCRYIVKGIFTLPLDWHFEHHSGDTLDKIEKGRQGIYAFASEAFIPIYAGVKLVVSVVMLTIYCHWAPLAIVPILGLTMWLIMKFDTKIMANYKLLNRGDNLVSASIMDAISHITTVVSLRLQDPKFNEISDNIDASFPLYKETNRINEFKWCLVSVCVASLWSLVLGMYYWQHKNIVGGIIMGNIYLLVRYLDEMGSLFERLADMYSEVLQRKSRVLNAEEIAKEFVAADPVEYTLPQDWKEIWIRNLSFKYLGNDGKTHHLKDISMRIRRGERIALVGMSGSGKSTFLKVLRNLHTPESIELFADGVLVENGFAAIERGIGFIQQLPELFATSVKNNITIGKKCSLDEINHFINLACFSQVVNRLPKGLDSVINERGVNLSGGERQKLALVRGLMASKGLPILVSDEPTSSVDQVTKAVIYANVFEEFRDSAIIFATHDVHLFPVFDQIYMFKEGRILGSGTFESLTESCPEFRELCERPQEEQVS